MIQNQNIIISPSLIASNLAELKDEIAALEDAGADMIHIDIMDGLFVPDISFGPHVISSIRKYTVLPFDIHLMTYRPETMISRYIDSGADIITIHPESTRYLHKTIKEIKRRNVSAGIALLPSTSITILDDILGDIDLILVMSVNPGFTNQTFIHGQLSIISLIRDMIAKTQTKVLLSAYGGINEGTGQMCLQAGARALVPSHYIFDNEKYKKQIDALRNSCCISTEKI